jgi:hypothetical protein
VVSNPLLVLLIYCRIVKLEDCDEAPSSIFAQPVAVLGKCVPTDDFPAFPLATTNSSKFEPHPILAYKIRKLDAGVEGKENKRP